MTKKQLEQLLLEIHQANPALPPDLQVRLDMAVKGTAITAVPSQVTEFVTRYYDWLSQNGGKQRYTEQEIQAGATTIDRLIRLDGFDLEQEIAPAIRWAVQDSFWSAQVRSLAQLRKKSAKNGDSKFNNLFGAYSAAQSQLKTNPMNRKEVIQDARSQRAAKLLARKYGPAAPVPGQGQRCHQQVGHTVL